MPDLFQPTRTSWLGGLPVHDSGHSSKLVLGDLTFPESAFRVQVQIQVQVLILVPPPDTSFAIGRAPVANETPAFLFHASVCRSERQTILPLSITWSRGIGRVVAIDNRNPPPKKGQKKSASS